MWIRQVLLAIIGFSAGVAVAGGLFSFIIGLGVVSDFADRTHTGDKILLYEDSIAMGGVIGNLIYVYQVHMPLGSVLLPLFGIFAGIFVGCWSMALADILNIFPIFIRRIKLARYVAWIILSMAVGKGVGSALFFFMRW